MYVNEIRFGRRQEKVVLFRGEGGRSILFTYWTAVHAELVLFAITVT